MKIHKIECGQSIKIGRYDIEFYFNTPDFNENRTHPQLELHGVWPGASKENLKLSLHKNNRIRFESNYSVNDANEPNKPYLGLFDYVFMIEFPYHIILDNAKIFVENGKIQMICQFDSTKDFIKSFEIQ